MWVKSYLTNFLIFTLASCTLLKKSGTANRIETEGNYIIVSQSNFLSKDEKLTSKIEGYVFDDYTKEPISFGFVFSIESNQYQAAIDSVGFFSLLLPHGMYKFKITSVGNKGLITEPIYLKPNTKTQLKIYLGSDIMYDKEYLQSRKKGRKK